MTASQEIALILIATWVVTMLLHAWLHDRAVTPDAPAPEPSDEWHWTPTAEQWDRIGGKR